MKLLNLTLTFNYIRKHNLILIQVVIAFIITLIVSVFDGVPGCVDNRCGLIIGNNARDGVWFQAVAATAFKTWPFRMPIFSGEILKGYHYLPNLLFYLFSLIGIPITFSFYQLFPTLYLIGITILSITLARKIHDDPVFVFFFLFFMYFGIPLTIVTSLYHFGYIKNGLLINTFQATMLPFNSHHFTLSFLIMFYILNKLKDDKILIKDRIIFSIMLFLTFGIKFYTATTILLLLIFYELISLFANLLGGASRRAPDSAQYPRALTGGDERQNLINYYIIRSFLINGLIYTISALLAIFVFYEPFKTVNNEPLFVWAPFSTVHHLIENTELFYLPRLVLARYTLYNHGWSPRLVAIELFSVFLFVLFYLGSRVIGFLYISKQFITKKITRFESVIFFTIIINITLAVLLVQRGDWYNPMQFAVCAAYLMNILAAQFVYRLWKNAPRWLALTTIMIIFILTFPSNLVNLGYLFDKGRVVVSNKEIEALSFLKKQPDGAVLSPIHEYQMPYISALTGKSEYATFFNVLQNTGIDYKQREEELKHPERLNTETVNIRYVYLVKTHPLYPAFKRRFSQSKIYKKIFNNETVEILTK